MLMKILIDTLKQQIGTKKAAVPIFGDAESIAAAAVILKALGAENVHYIHIDHGLLRSYESEYVYDALCHIGAKNIIRISAEADFSTATAVFEKKVIGPLANTYNPIHKRVLMNTTLEKFFRRSANEISKDAVLVGIYDYCDIKFSLNSKDVKALTENLGINEMLIRQPFPTPALAVRIICNDSVIALTTEQRQLLSECVSSFGNEYTAKLLPIRTVGIKNGKRSYTGMAMICADACNSDFATVQKIATNVHNTLPFISRCALRVDSNAPAALCHDRPLSLSRDAINAVRVANDVVEKAFAKTSAVQFFAVLIPIVIDKSKNFSVIIRAVLTGDFKTASAAIPGIDFPLEVLKNASAEIKKVLGDTVDMVLYDMTPKPPAAIEFE